MRLHQHSSLRQRRYHFPEKAVTSLEIIDESRYSVLVTSLMSMAFQIKFFPSGNVQVQLGSKSPSVSKASGHLHQESSLQRLMNIKNIGKSLTCQVRSSWKTELKRMVR